jgi:hypothetical protein
MISYSIVLSCVAAVGLVVPGTHTDIDESSRATQQTSPAKPAEPNDLPVSLERIQKKLMRDPAIKVDVLPVETESGLPTFRIQVDAPKLSIEQILGPDFLRGPVPYGGMTHQEFLNIVTPTEVKGFAAFTNTEGVTVALTALALQWALKTALQELREAKDERAREEARKEVKEALEALRKARRDAGLPDK